MKAIIIATNEIVEIIQIYTQPNEKDSDVIICIDEEGNKYYADELKQLRDEK